MLPQEILSNFDEVIAILPFDQMSFSAILEVLPPGKKKTLSPFWSTALGILSKEEASQVFFDARPYI